MNSQSGAHAKISLQLTLLAGILSCPVLSFPGVQPEAVLTKAAGTGSLGLESGSSGCDGTHKAPSSGWHILSAAPLPGAGLREIFRAV